MYTNIPHKIENGGNNTKATDAYSNKRRLVKTNILGINITNEKEDKILEYLTNFIKNTSKKLYIVTPNPEIVMFAQAHTEFKSILNMAEIALCDGIGLLRASQVLGKPLKERIIGTNFMDKLCQNVEDWPVTVGFLGGRPSIAKKAAECLLTKYPKLKVVFAEADEKQLYMLPRGGMPMILFVAFGAPKQEQWMAENINTLPTRVMMGVGGAFDQIVDSSLRPPSLVHQLGLGWLYRLVRQPWRIKRQRVLFSFVGLVLKEKFHAVFA